MLRAFLVMLFGLCAFAQSFDESWRMLAGANPAGATLTLHVAEPHRFRVGELIPIDVNLSDPKMGTDRMYSFSGVLLDPASSCGIRLNLCHVQNTLAGIPGEITKLGKSKGTIQGELNLYVPPLAPGTYRVAIVADYSVRVSGTPERGVYYGPSKAVSNVEEFEIVPATAEWAAQTVDAASEVLRSGSRDTLQRTRAARTLRYLQTPPAWQASLDLLARSPEELLAGLTEAHDEPAVCKVMLDRLTAPQQLVTAAYLYALDTVCPEPIPKPGPGEIIIRQQRLSPVGPAADALAAHLDEKKPAVKRAAVEALLAYAENRRYSGEPAPEWMAKLRKELSGPRQPEHPSLRIISPSDRAVVKPGDTVHVVVNANGVFSDVGVLDQWRLFGVAARKAPPYEFEVRVPKTDIDAGSYTLVAMGVLTSGERVESEPVEVEVQPAWKQSDDASHLVEDAPGVSVDTGGVPLVHRTALAYPAEASARGVGGTVVMEITPDSGGRTYEAHVISGPQELRQIDVSTWHFVNQVGQSPRQVKIAFDLAKAERSANAGTSEHLSPFGVPNTNLFFWRLPNPRDGCFYGSGAITERKLRTLDILGISENARARLVKFAPVKEGDLIGTEQMARMVNWSGNSDEDLRVWMLQAGDDYAVTVMPRGFILGAREKATQQELANMCELPKEARTIRRIRVPEAVQSASLVSRTAPVAPNQLRGVVHLHVIVNEQGRVIYVGALSGSAPLIPPALDVVRQWIYAPTLVDGKPVQVISEVTLTF